MSTVQEKTRKRFPRLSSNAFEHPLDKAALETVRKIPFIDKLFKKMIELGFEKNLRIQLLGMACHVTPKQCPRVYKLLREACDILDMHEPDLFLMNHFTVNAWTFGVERPFIVLHSALVDLLDDDQLRGVIGHELGHVKANHVLYRTIVYFMLELIRAFGGLSNRIAQIGIWAALMDWARKSELTADRAELLVTQDVKVCIATHMKMTAGSKTVYEELDTEEFLKQGAKYEDLDYDMLNKFYKFFFELQLSHPLPVYRAKELKDWSESKQYQEILAGRYPSKDEDLSLRDCPHCGAKVSPTFFFCPDCGKNARM
ncbi:MAG TPA: M48 family metalloprotease [Candidatus Obscuribacterales bacterium]